MRCPKQTRHGTRPGGCLAGSDKKCPIQSVSMYDRSLLALARGVWRGFMPGLARAGDEASDV